MIVFRTARVKLVSAFRTFGIAFQIFRNGESMAARSAENCLSGTFDQGPHLRRMIRNRRMTFETRVPTLTALELYRYYVEFAVPMRASRLFVDFDAVNLFTMNQF